MVDAGGEQDSPDHIPGVEQDQFAPARGNGFAGRYEGAHTDRRKVVDRGKVEDRR